MRGPTMMTSMVYSCLRKEHPWVIFWDSREARLTRFLAGLDATLQHTNATQHNMCCKLVAAGFKHVKHAPPNMKQHPAHCSVCHRM